MACHAPSAGLTGDRIAAAATQDIARIVELVAPHKKAAADAAKKAKEACTALETAQAAALAAGASCASACGRAAAGRPPDAGHIVATAVDDVPDQAQEAAAIEAEFAERGAFCAAAP